MGIDWETILDAEGADLADAYEDMVFDAMEKMDYEWQEREQYFREQQGVNRCVPFPAPQSAEALPEEDFGLDEEGVCGMCPELELPPGIYLGNTVGLNAVNERIFNILLSIQGFIVDSGALHDNNGLWKMARDMCAFASFPLELSYGTERSVAESRLCRYRHARQSVECAATMTRFTDLAASGYNIAVLWAKLDELDKEIQKYDEALHGDGQ